MEDNNSRHIACNRCRQRKVKCDGRRPYCRRCAKGSQAWDCIYESSKTQKGARELSAGQMDDERITSSVADAEDDAMVHDQAYPTSSPTGIDSPTYLSVTAHSWRESYDFLNQEPTSEPKPESGAEVWCHEYPECIDDVQPIAFRRASEPHAGQESPILDSQSRSVDSLVSVYFSTHQPVHFVFTIESFCLMISSMTLDALAIRYAMCAHVLSAASFSIADTRSAQHFYLQARHTLGESEKDIFNEISLQRLQATILIGMYEIQQANFSSAWSTASRALWLMQSLRLDRLDTQQSDFWDIEEARRTLWSARSLIGFFALSDCRLETSASDEINAFLPRDNKIEVLEQAVTFRDIMTKANHRPLCIQEGITSAMMLVPRIATHIRCMRSHKSPELTSYSFWRQCHALEDTLHYLMQSTPESETPGLDLPIQDCQSRQDLTMLLDALLVVLHEASLANAQKSTSWTPKELEQMLKAQNSALQRSLEISNIAQNLESDSNKLVPTLTAWSVYVAMQSLLRHQHRVAARQSCEVFGSDNGAALTRCDSALSENLTQIGRGSHGCPNLALDEAVFLDSYSGLRAVLTEQKQPLSHFFLNEVTTESLLTASQLDERDVGLAGFSTTTATWSSTPTYR